MWFGLTRGLGAIVPVVLLASIGWADDLQFYSRFASQPAEEADVGCDIGCDVGCGQACRDCWCLANSTYGFFAFDAWENQADLDDGNNFGFRTGLNTGVPLLPRYGIGAQLGASFGCYDLMGRDQGAVDSIETETMITAGVFKRANYACSERLSWAIAYDHQFRDNYAKNGGDSLGLGQFRGLVGYALNCRNEVGVWFTQSNGDKDPIPAASASIGLELWEEPVQQYNLFWRRYWECGGDTMLYFGAVEDPGEFVVGLNARVPLNSRWALFGAATYIKPSVDAGVPGYIEDTWSLTAGMAFYPGRNAQSCCGGSTWQPLLPVADNGTFAIDTDSRGPLP